MSEDYGIIHYKNFNQGDASSALITIRECINAAISSGEYYWEIDNSIVLSDPDVQLALKAKNNPSLSSFPFSHGNPNDQRIAIRALSVGKLQIAYAPDGWGGISNFNSLDSTTKTWTGFRSITGKNTEILNLPTTVWVVQYRDSSITTSYPASTIAIVLGNSVKTLEYCAYAGRGITVQNPSDFNLGLCGDCLLTGVADFLLKEGLLLNSLSPSSDSSIARVGIDSWNYIGVNEFSTSQVSDIILNTKTIRRMFPYQINGYYQSTKSISNSTFGIIGTTKHLRKSLVLNSLGDVISSTLGSKQKWKYIANNSSDPRFGSMYILWGPENQVT